MVPVATIIDCQTLKDFERNIIVGHEKWDFVSPNERCNFAHDDFTNVPRLSSIQ